MAVKEKVIGNVAIAGPVNYIEVKVKSNDDTIESGARTKLSVSLKSLWGVAIGGITIEPILNPGAMVGLIPRIDPVDADNITLSPGETETYEFILSNPNLAPVTAAIDVLVYTAGIPPYIARNVSWRSGIPDPGSTAAGVPLPAGGPGAIGPMTLP